MISRGRYGTGIFIGGRTEKTKEEVKQDLFGEYLFEDSNLHKRPLSKLIKDISTELGLI